MSVSSMMHVMAPIRGQLIVETCDNRVTIRSLDSLGFRLTLDDMPASGPRLTADEILAELRAAIDKAATAPRCAACGRHE